MWIGRIISSEALKTKRTLAFGLAIATPGVIAALQVGIIGNNGLEFVKGLDDAWYWLAQQTMMLWSLLMMPLVITLETALLAGLEHHTNHWKQLLALSVPRGAIYLGKLLSGIVLNAVSVLVMAVFVVICGLGLRIAFPDTGFTAAIPWGDLAQFSAFSFLGSLLLVSIHTWVAIRWSSFPVSLGFGIIMTVAGIFVMNADWGIYYPWALPGMMINGLRQTGTILPAVLAEGIGGGLLLGLFGIWDFGHREIA